MEHTYWHKQPNDKPLFSELLWDKPENKIQAGKLLIIGGNAHSFAVPAAAYAEAQAAGIGVVKVLLPDALKKSVGPILENGEYAPSTKSGSFSKQALAEWLDFAQWSNGILLPGDLGRNSETAIALEQLLVKYDGQITITHDALDYFTANPQKLVERSDTTIVASFAQLQRLATGARFTTAFTYDTPLANMTESLHKLSIRYPCSFVMKHSGIFYIAKDGEVSTTQTSPNENVWRVATAARVSVWTLQNPSKQFEALTCAIYEQQMNQ